MHVHFSALDALASFAAFIVLAFLWRSLAYHLSAKGSPWGAAMLVIL